MSTFRSLSRFAVAALAIVLLAGTAYSYSDEAVKDAEALLKATVERSEKGEVTRTDVAQAEHYLLEMKYEAVQLPRADYCKAAMPSLQLIVKGVADEARVGQRTTAEVIEARRNLQRVKTTCSKT